MSHYDDLAELYGTEPMAKTLRSKGYVVERPGGRTPYEVVRIMAELLQIEDDEDTEGNTFTLQDVARATLELAIRVGVHPENFLTPEEEWPPIPWSVG